MCRGHSTSLHVDTPCDDTSEVLSKKQQVESSPADQNLQPGDWIRLLQNYLVKPQPKTSPEEKLRGRARAVALKRLKKTMGTMALEEQAPEKEIFRKLLEKRTNEILYDPRERLWLKDDN